MSQDFFRLDLQILFCLLEENLDWNHDSLAAPYWRFYWNKRGNSLLRFGREKVILDESRYLLIPPNTNFCCESYRLIDHFYTHFVARPPFDRVKEQVVIIDRSEEMDRLISNICQLMTEGKRHLPVFSVLCHALCSNALIHVPSEGVSDVFIDERLNAIISRLRNSLRVGIDNDSLAKSVGMNTNSFIKYFKKILGITPQRYLRRLQIENACVLLQFTDLSLEDIADRCGFCDRYHLSKVFKAHRGRAPVEYRKTVT